MAELKELKEEAAGASEETAEEKMEEAAEEAVAEEEAAEEAAEESADDQGAPADSIKVRSAAVRASAPPP